MAKLAKNSLLTVAFATVLTVSVSAPAPSFAGLYLPVNDAAESAGFFDLGSMKAVKRERWGWYVVVAKHVPSALPDRADVVALNIRFDCARGQMQIVGSNRFLSDRRPLQLDSTSTDTAPVPPDTAFSRMMEAACDGKFEKAAAMETPAGFTMFDLSAAVKRAVAQQR